MHRWNGSESVEDQQQTDSAQLIFIDVCWNAKSKENYYREGYGDQVNLWKRERLDVVIFH